jgi:hypothetical protein
MKISLTRDALGRIGIVAFCALALWISLGSFVAWIFGVPDIRPREGESCAPGYVWTYVGSNVTDPELSCERE